MSEMIMASFMKIWHLIPIAIAIVLFKIYLNKRDKQKRILKNQAHEKNGLTLEVRTKKQYEDKGYKVKELGENDQGIDFILSKENKTLLLKCNDTNEPKSITDADIKTFHRNATKYAKENAMEGLNMELRYVIPYNDVLHKSAIKLLSNDSYGCKYVVM